MGCFAACFGTSKHRKKNLKLSPKTTLSKNQLRHYFHSGEIGESLALQPIKPADEFLVEEPIKPSAESVDNKEERLKISERQEVAFDLEVKSDEKCSVQEFAKCLVETDKGKEEEKTVETKDDGQAYSDSTSGMSSVFSYPLNHRYHNCTNSDDEFEEIDLKDSELVDDDVNGKDNGNGGDDKALVIQEESSESLFSLSIESRKLLSAAEKGEKEVSSPLKICTDGVLKSTGLGQNARNRSQYVHSVLNPVENLSQWRAVKAQTTLTLKHQEKENTNSGQDFDIPLNEEPSFKQPSQCPRQDPRKPNPPDKEFAVDTSLSSWLIGSGEKTPNGKHSPPSVGNSPRERTKSPKSFEDRPILGALTVEELKQSTKSSSPRRSPSHSADDKPIIGTVGSYWRHTGQATHSDSSSSCRGMSASSNESRHFRERKTNCHTTPFQTRLERVTKTEDAQGSTSTTS